MLLSIGFTLLVDVTIMCVNDLFETEKDANSISRTNQQGADLFYYGGRILLRVDKMTNNLMQIVHKMGD